MHDAMLSQLLVAVIVLAILGLVVFLIERLIPMPVPYREAIRALVGIGFLIWLAHVFGGWRL